MRPRALLAVAALLIAAGIGAFGWRHATRPPAAAPVAGAVERIRPDHAGMGIDDLRIDAAALPAPTYESLAGAASPASSLPPADLPLVERFEALDAAARRGNAAAACQLGAELARCGSLRLSRNMLAETEREIEGLALQDDAALVGARVDLIAMRGKLIEDAQRTCAGAETLPAMERLRYFGIAARAGHVASMVEYLGIQHLGAATLIRDPGLAAEFRRDAPTFFQRALAAGDPRLLQAWVTASHLPEMSALHAILPPEWRSTAFTAALISQLDEAQRSRLVPGFSVGASLDISDDQRAEAERVFAEHFAELQKPGDSTSPPDELRWLRDALGTERFRCDELAG